MSAKRHLVKFIPQKEDDVLLDFSQRQSPNGCRELSVVEAFSAGITYCVLVSFWLLA
jgi:hypothetical protein